MMKRTVSLLGVVLASVATNLSAQSNAVSEDAEAPTYRPFTLGLEGSTTGPGIAADWRFSDHFGARVGFNYFEFSKDGKEIEATFVRLAGGKVTLRNVAGREYTITLDTLSAESQAHAKERAARKP